MRPLVSKQHDLQYLYTSYGHNNPIISQLYHTAQERRTDNDKIKQLTLAAQHVYREHRYFERTVSKPLVHLFLGWNIPPTVSGEHFIKSMIEVAGQQIPFSEEEKQDIYASMLAPYQRHQQQCHI